MIVDSSALVAVLLQEPSFDELLEQLSAAESRKVGAPTVVETGIVMVARVGLAGKTLLARLLEEGSFDTVTVGPEHWTIAVDAYARFGKGRYSAALNFGDCLTYAVAKHSGEPLLCIGNDFARTDLDLVIGNSAR